MIIIFVGTACEMSLLAKSNSRPNFPPAIHIDIDLIIFSSHRGGACSRVLMVGLLVGAKIRVGCPRGCRNGAGHKKEKSDTH